MQDVLKKLKAFSPKVRGGYIDLTVPVVLNLDGGLLELRIRPGSDGYRISCPRDLFADANGTGAFYFDIFLRHGGDAHGVKVKNGRLVREFSAEESIVFAMDETIRFFIRFDAFFIENGVIGNEEAFL